jgi:hypothetical protein
MFLVPFIHEHKYDCQKVSYGYLSWGVSFRILSWRSNPRGHSLSCQSFHFTSDVIYLGELVTICNQLKMVADDKKMRLTSVTNVETLLQLVQSVLVLVHDQPGSVPPGTDRLQKV